MLKLKYVLAYILGIFGWFGGIVVGIIWSLLYGGYQEIDVIDIPTVLMENITPAIVSVFLGNYIFIKIFPDTSSKKINTIIFYVILFLNYGVILSENIANSNYTNIIYVLTGIVCLAYLIYQLLNNPTEQNK